MSRTQPPQAETSAARTDAQHDPTRNVGRTHAVVRRTQSAHLTLPVRFLLTDPTDTLVARTITVPVQLRRALARQRLHAIVVGQRPQEQLLTYDGSKSNPSFLAWYRTGRTPLAPPASAPML